MAIDDTFRPGCDFDDDAVSHSEIADDNSNDDDQFVDK
jgi:hypothetical protein